MPPYLVHHSRTRIRREQLQHPIALKRLLRSRILNFQCNESWSLTNSTQACPPALARVFYINKSHASCDTGRSGLCQPFATFLVHIGFSFSASIAMNLNMCTSSAIDSNASSGLTRWLENNNGFRRHELNRIRHLITSNLPLIPDSWEQHCG